MSIPPDALENQVRNITDDRRADLIITTCVCFPIVFISVALRFFSRRLIKYKPNWSDWLVLASLVPYTINQVCLGVTTRLGLGRHTILVTDIAGLTRITLVSQSTYCAVVTLVKLSLAVFFLKLFPQKWFKHVIWGTFFLIISWFLFAFLSTILQCLPIEYTWDRTIPGGRCIAYGRYLIAIGVYNIVTDFWLLAIPLPIVWSLNTTTTKKWLISFTFAAGSGACVVSIVRLNFLINVGDPFDPAWENVNAAMVSTIEMMIMILACNIPTYRPLYNYFIGGNALGSKAANSAQMYRLGPDSKRRTDNKKSSYLEYGNATLGSSGHQEEDQERLHQGVAGSSGRIEA